MVGQSRFRITGVQSQLQARWERQWPKLSERIDHWGRRFVRCRLKRWPRRGDGLDRDRDWSRNLVWLADRGARCRSSALAAAGARSELAESLEGRLAGPRRSLKLDRRFGTICPVIKVGASRGTESLHDSPLEGDGFEPSVPRSKESQIFRRRPLQDKSESIKLPVAWGSTRRTDHLGSFLPRRLCLEIGRRGGACGTVMLTSVSSVHNSKIMLGMLIKVLCGHAIAAGRRLSREGSVTFEDLMRSASDLDVRSGTIETVTSLRDLWPIRVRIVTVITTMRSAVLSCSHETF